MNLIDKLLLGTLVLLLPIGLVVSFIFFKNPAEGQPTQETQVDTTKLEELIKETVAQNQPKIEKPKPFAITEVSFASQSAVLKLKGTAPQHNTSVMISATVLPRNPQSPDPQEYVKGAKVETLSVFPDSNGSFVFEYPIEKNNLEDVLELRLEQNDTITTVKFDLKEKQQVL